MTGEVARPNHSTYNNRFLPADRPHDVVMVLAKIPISSNPAQMPAEFAKPRIAGNQAGCTFRATRNTRFAHQIAGDSGRQFSRLGGCNCIRPHIGCIMHTHKGLQSILTSFYLERCNPCTLTMADPFNLQIFATSGPTCK